MRSSAEHFLEGFAGALAAMQARISLVVGG